MAPVARAAQASTTTITVDTNTDVAGNLDSGSANHPDLSCDTGSNVWLPSSSLIGSNEGCDTFFPAGTPNAAGNLVGTNALPLDPLLQTLAYHGGLIPVHHPEYAPISPLIDQGSCSENTIDQRLHGNPVAFNGYGHLAFVARLSGAPIGTTNDTAVFSGTHGSVALLAWEGQPASGGGGPYGEISEPSIGPHGAVAFMAGSAVYLNGVEIAQVGDPAPRGGTIQSVSFPAIHDSLVFRAEVLDGGLFLDSYMMLVGGDDLLEVVREGDIAPETGGQTFSMLISNAVVNGCGQIPFIGRLADGRDGLWVFGRTGNGVLIALEGEPSPHGPDYLSFSTSFLADRAARTSLEDGGYRYFNQAGQLACRASLVDGSRGVFLSGLPGIPCDRIFEDGFESGNTSAW